MSDTHLTWPWRRVCRDQTGASAVEYGLLVAGIAALIVGVVFLFGGFVSGMFSDTCSSIANHPGNVISGSCSPSS